MVGDTDAVVLVLPPKNLVKGEKQIGILEQGKTGGGTPRLSLSEAANLKDTG